MTTTERIKSDLLGLIKIIPDGDLDAINAEGKRIAQKYQNHPAREFLLSGKYVLTITPDGVEVQMPVVLS